MRNLTINVGDYARNKYGIAKVLEISEDVVKEIQTIKFDRPICFLVNLETGEERNRTNILPITPNIDLDKIKIGKLINLIEEGDYVNGHLVIKRHNDLMLEDTFDLVQDEDIKSIVTKEQMEAMEYKIEK